MKLPAKRNHLSRGAAVLLAFSGIIMSSQRAAAQNPNPGTAPVTVQNTSAHPVPITGTVVVTSQPSQQTSAFQATGLCTLGSGGFIFTNSCNIYVVPLGKRAVIE